jgi:nondiscriminating aspartyl-tRNA synthetase
MSVPIIPVSAVDQHLDDVVSLRGWVHTRRDLGGISFLLLRDATGVIQCVFQGTDLPLHESCVLVTGKVVANRRAPGNFEVQAQELELISEALLPPPVEISKEEWHANPETLLAYRHVTVRGLKARAALKVKAELVRAFRAFLDERGFTEIFTPKLVSAGAESGANMFEVDYYGRKAFLAQSPQLYKQIMASVFERVYETAPVYRAEQSHTNRHLSEYLSLDVELAFIRDDSEIMDLQEELMRSVTATVSARCAREFTELDAKPVLAAEPFPRITLLEARDLVTERYGHEPGGKDLDPEAERLLGRWALEEHGSDFVFVTNYPQEARPFYTYPLEGGLTRGLDLLFRGMEITSGGQRVHEYDVLLGELQRRRLAPEDFAGYLEIFRHGMPPHGGFAAGAERLTALLLGIANVRFARAFPRDSGRLQP